MNAAQEDQITLLDVLVLIGVAAVGSWAAAPYRDGIPIPIIARPGFPVLPIFLSVPMAAALTVGSLAVPLGTFRARAHRFPRYPGTALCAAAAFGSLVILIRWSIRAWINPYADGSLFVYGAAIFRDWGSWCGVAVGAVLVLLVLSGQIRRQVGWAEWVRLDLGIYWLAMLFVFGLM